MTKKKDIKHKLKEKVKNIILKILIEKNYLEPQ
jgi:hypothetical protein